MLEFALWSVNNQTCHNSFIDASLVSCGVSTVLEEDLDFRARFNQTDMDLIILVIIFLFNAHISLFN